MKDVTLCFDIRTGDSRHSMIGPGRKLISDASPVPPPAAEVESGKSFTQPRFGSPERFLLADPHRVLN